MGYCFLCGKTMNSKETPMHKFPKNPSLKAAWLKFCNLNETDNVSTVKLCSAHFTAADYIEPRARELGSTAFLKPGTVPSISKPPLGSSGTIHTDNLSNRKLATVQYEYAEATCSTPIFSPSHSTKSQIQKRSRVEPEIAHTSLGQSIPKKQPENPRYVDDIRNAHFSNTELDERTFDMPRRKILEQAKKIKHFQRQDRLLTKKIDHLQQLREVLEKQKKLLLPENLFRSSDVSNRCL